MCIDNLAMFYLRDITETGQVRDSAVYSWGKQWKEWHGIIVYIFVLINNQLWIIFLAIRAYLEEQDFGEMLLTTWHSST